MTDTSTVDGLEHMGRSKIPVRAAKTVAHQYGLKQCLLIGWDGELAHVVTYGRTKEDCEAAAKAQDFWTGKIRELAFSDELSRLRSALAKARVALEEVQRGLGGRTYCAYCGAEDAKNNGHDEPDCPIGEALEAMI